MPLTGLKVMRYGIYVNAAFNIIIEKYMHKRKDAYNFQQRSKKEKVTWLENSCYIF